MTEDQLAQAIADLEMELSKPLAHPDLAPKAFFQTLHLASLRRFRDWRAAQAALSRGAPAGSIPCGGPAPDAPAASERRASTARPVPHRPLLVFRR